MSKIGMNVALGLDTQQFQAGIAKSKAQMQAFGRDAKKLGALSGKFGLGGAGRGFGIAGDALDLMSGGGMLGKIGGGVMAAVGVIQFLSAVNRARQEAKTMMDELKATGKEFKANEQFSNFAPLAAKVPGTSGPGIAATLTQQMASNKWNSGGFDYFQSSFSGALEQLQQIGETLMSPSDFFNGDWWRNYADRANTASALSIEQDPKQANVLRLQLEQLRRQTDALTAD